MRRYKPGPPGVVIYQAVPIRSASALLHVSGIPRDQPSHTLRVFFNHAAQNDGTSVECDSYVTDFLTYNSAPATGSIKPAGVGMPLPTSQGDHEVVIDVSHAMGRIEAAATTVDITFALVDLGGHTLTASDFHFSAVSLSRRP